MSTRTWALWILGAVSLQLIGGCTRVSGITRKNYDQIAISSPNVLVEDKINTEGAAPIGEYDNYSEDILRLLKGDLSRQNLSRGRPFSVTSISIAVAEDYEPATVHVLAILSTVLPIPTSFFRTKNDIAWKAKYSVMDASGRLVYDRQLAGEVVGYYMGWSFIRYAKRSSLRNEQGRSVAVSIANAIANDIVLNFPTMLEHLAVAEGQQ